MESTGQNAYKKYFRNNIAAFQNNSSYLLHHPALQAFSHAFQGVDSRLFAKHSIWPHNGYTYEKMKHGNLLLSFFE